MRCPLRRNAFLRELLLRFADEGNLWNRVNTVRIVCAIGMDGDAEGIGGRDAPLFHGDRAEAGKADNVADGKDVRLLGPVILVHGNASARVGLEARGGQDSFVDVALPPHRVQQCVARHLFLALQHRGDSVVGSLFDAFDLFVQAHGNAAVPQVIAERLHHFGIGQIRAVADAFQST